MAIQLSPHFGKAMRSVLWNRVSQSKMHGGRLEISVYFNIKRALPIIEARIENQNVLLNLIEGAAESVEILRTNPDETEQYYTQCVLLSMFIRAYLEPTPGSVYARKIIQQIGIACHCPTVRELLENHPIQ